MRLLYDSVAVDSDRTAFDQGLSFAAEGSVRASGCRIAAEDSARASCGLMAHRRGLSRELNIVHTAQSRPDMMRGRVSCLGTILMMLLRGTMQRSAARMARGIHASRPAQSEAFDMSTFLFKSDHSVHGMRLYHKLNFALIGLGPLALLLSPSSLSVPIDYMLGVIIPLHGHLGGNDVISDYAHKVTKAEWFARGLRNGLFGVTVITFFGLLKLNVQGPGVTEAFKSVWRPRSTSNAKQ